MTTPVEGMEGQDWASYQDYSPSVRNVLFVFIKVTEGTGYANPKYSSQLATARAGNLFVGHYHFVKAGPSVQAQVDYFLRKASLHPGDAICLDWEDAGVTSTEKDAWLKYARTQIAGNIRTVLYCNKDFWFNRDHSGFYGDALWIADPDSPKGHPAIKSTWLFHQYGESNGMDLDYCPLSLDQLKRWGLTGSASAPSEVPDMLATDNLTIHKGGWADQDETDTVGNWLVYANKKAEKAADAAAEALTKATAAAAQSATNGSTLSTLVAKVDALRSTNLTPEQVSAIAAEVAPAVAALLPKPPTASEIADEIYHRMQQ